MPYKKTGPVIHFGKIRIGSTEIEISAEPENKYGCHAIETICWNSRIIKSQTLELLYKVHRKNERYEYVKAIDDYRIKENL